LQNGWGAALSTASFWRSPRRLQAFKTWQMIDFERAPGGSIYSSLIFGRGMTLGLSPSGTPGEDVEIGMEL
jgi:hypothetical protein